MNVSAVMPGLFIPVTITPAATAAAVYARYVTGNLGITFLYLTSSGAASAIPTGRPHE